MRVVDRFESLPGTSRHDTTTFEIQQVTVPAYQKPNLHVFGQRHHVFIVRIPTCGLSSCHG